MKKKLEEDMKALIAENDRQLMEMKVSYEEKLAQTHLQKEQNYNQDLEHNKDMIEVQRKDNPHLSNLNFDQQLSGKIIHIIRKGANRLGKINDCDIILYGPSIQDFHSTIYRRDNDSVILEKASDDAKILLNGDQIIDRTYLNHNDRWLFYLSISELFLILLILMSVL